jgi:hypothetical protein
MRYEKSACERLAAQLNTKYNMPLCFSDGFRECITGNQKFSVMLRREMNGQGIPAPCPLPFLSVKDYAVYRSFLGRAFQRL